ncbi:MAG: hypothetical protein HYU97_02535 [Deltaproteobacteria bacterium]|nr:hypothetical protein [Deltaproteobacteria bacterium]
MKSILNLFIITLFLSLVACGGGDDPKTKAPVQDPALSLEEILSNNLNTINEGEGDSFSDLNLSAEQVKFLAENVAATAYFGNLYGLLIQSAEDQGIPSIDGPFDYTREATAPGAQGTISGKVHGTGNISDEFVDGIFTIESNLNGYAIDEYYVLALTGSHQGTFHVQGNESSQSVAAELTGTFSVSGWLGGSKVSFQITANFPSIEERVIPTTITGKMVLISKDQTYVCDFDGKNFINQDGKTVTTGANCKKI